MCVHSNIVLWLKKQQLLLSSLSSCVLFLLQLLISVIVSCFHRHAIFPVTFATLILFPYSITVYKFNIFILHFKGWLPEPGMFSGIRAFPLHTLSTSVPVLLSLLHLGDFHCQVLFLLQCTVAYLNYCAFFSRCRKQQATGWDSPWQLWQCSQLQSLGHRWSEVSARGVQHLWLDQKQQKRCTSREQRQLWLWQVSFSVTGC